ITVESLHRLLRDPSFYNNVDRHTMEVLQMRCADPERHTISYQELVNMCRCKSPKSLQRVRGLWKIYLGSSADRDKLVINGLLSQKTHSSLFDGQNYLRLPAKNKPCSADRERLRIDAMLTTCQTGDRIIMCDPLAESLLQADSNSSRPISPKKSTVTSAYRKVKTQKLAECPNDWICRACKTPGCKEAEAIIKSGKRRCVRFI
ncbi:hypothetical protein FSP39_019679, partial [Pinctada imbricata]